MTAHTEPAPETGRSTGSSVRAGFVLNAVLAAAWLALWLGLAGLGVSWIATDSSGTQQLDTGNGGSLEFSMDDDVGDLIGLFTVFAGLVGAGVAGTLLYGAIYSARGTRANTKGWIFLDLAALATALWFLVGIARSTGDDPVNRLHLAGWVLQAGLAIVAAVLLRRRYHQA